MAHHGENMAISMFQEALSEQLGATGKYPEGKLNETDEGEIQFGISHDPATAKIIINFGKPVAWMGMTVGQALEIAESLKKHAEVCRKKYANSQFNAAIAQEKEIRQLKKQRNRANAARLGPQDGDRQQ